VNEVPSSHSVMVSSIRPNPRTSQARLQPGPVVALEVRREAATVGDQRWMLPKSASTAHTASGGVATWASA
jgi:hypothetical protein